MALADCKFCELGQADRGWILNHGDVVSFKPYGATAKGHRLFIPKEHVAGAAERPDLTARCFEEAVKWAAAHPGDFNLVVNSGATAGQTVFHLHVHYIPRTANDGVTL